MKKYRSFILRVVDLALIFAVLCQYQHVTLLRAEASAQRQKEIDAVNAYNASVLQAEQEDAEGGWQDGTYEGSALGFGDIITVAVTIQNGRISNISVLDASGEDRSYYEQALSVLDKMAAAQSTEVDTVSGATLTAEGLINAVADALGKAEK